MHRQHRLILICLICLMGVTSSALAGDAWWKICRPLPDSVKPRLDPCAHETFRWAAKEVLRAPKVCVQKTCSLRSFKNAWKCAWQDVCNAPKHDCDARESCREAVDAYHGAADELRRCHECEQN